MVRKPVRSVSGVTPLTLVLKPKKCKHGTCLYCPGGDFVPQSYTDKSPAIMRALALKFDPYAQVMNRLGVLTRMGHPTEKIEIIIIGGTFLEYELKYQNWFVKRCFDALNGFDSENFEKAKKLNEKAEHRCVALCIENRPDACSDEEIKRMLKFGATRVELGVQILDDEIYKKVNRGHTIQDVVLATRKLKNAGFKVGYHIMPGLPFSNLKKDIEKFKMVFSDERFKPDQVKIYPCQVVKDSPLAKIHSKINYVPYTTEQTKKVLIEMMKIIPRYCRIMRVMREIPKEKMDSEIIKLDVRKDIEETLRRTNMKINEIRYREIGFNDKSLDTKLKLKITKYKASDGEEYFLEIVNRKDILFGLLRLRIFNSEDNLLRAGFASPPGSQSRSENLSHPQTPTTTPITLAKLLAHPFAPSAQNFSRSYSSTRRRFVSVEKQAIIRELHVYGQALELGDESSLSVQHKGLGKWLLSEAEKIIKKNKIKELKIISGVGVREYYRKLGYKLDKEKIYMMKKI